MVCDRDNGVKPWQSQERSIVLHIGNRNYDVRDLVYRLLRAEGEVMALMDKVADLQTHVRVLEDKMSAREPEIDNNSKILEDFLKGEWKIRTDWIKGC
jgi:sirohydrochlorin ferrochelatase